MTAIEVNAYENTLLYENVNLYQYNDAKGYASEKSYDLNLVAFSRRDLGLLDAQAKNEAIITGPLIIDNKTALCNLGCVSCSTPDVCTICSAGYYLNGISCLKGRAKRCKVLSTVDTCNIFFEGYYPDSLKLCTKCADSCLTCMDTPGNCLTCRPESVLQGSSYIACIANCDDCSSTTNTTLCNACRPGFIYDSATST